MSKEVTKDEVVTHKKKAIKALNKAFEALINSPKPQHQKKANLLAYWIESFSDYVLCEERFDYHKIPRYKRGEVISVNFGFNVGNSYQDVQHQSKRFTQNYLHSLNDHKKSYGHFICNKHFSYLFH